MGNIMGNLILLGVVLAGFIGWGMNTYKLVVECDFASPYKCEGIRGVGTFVPIVGAVTGYIDIKDE